MKRVLFISLLFLVCSALHAQHIKFAGISLGQSIESTIEVFKSKGFVPNEEWADSPIIRSNEDKAWVNLRGPFWRNENSLICIHADYGKAVTRISVEITSAAPNSFGKKLLKELQESLDKKYGIHKSVYESIASVNYLRESIWKVSFGEIRLDYATGWLTYLDCSYLNRVNVNKVMQDNDL